MPPTYVPCSNGSLPLHAVQGGKDHASVLYVARAYHGGSLVPGKLSPLYKTVYISYGGKEHEKTGYEVLTCEDPGLSWVSACGGSLPPGAVKGGWEEDGAPLYVARARVGRVQSVGKLNPRDHTFCHVSYGGKEHIMREYEVLVYTPNLGITPLDMKQGHMVIAKELEEWETATVTLSKDGIQCFHQAVGILAAQTEESYEAADKAAQQLIPIVNMMKDKFEESSKISIEVQDKIQKKTEKMLVEISRMQNETKEKENNETLLQKKMEGARSTLAIQNSRLSHQESQLQKKQSTYNDTNQKYQDEVRHRETVRDVGSWLFLIPIAGWIAGGIMVTVAETALAASVDNLKGEVDRLRTQVNSQRSAVNSAREAVNRTENELTDNTRSQDNLRNQVKVIKTILASAKIEEKRIHELKEKVQSFATMAESFFASASNASKAVRDAVSIEQMLGPMAALMERLGNGNGLPNHLQNKIVQAQRTWDNIKQLKPASLEAIDEWEEEGGGLGRGQPRQSSPRDCSLVTKLVFGLLLVGYLSNYLLLGLGLFGLLLVVSTVYLVNYRQ